MGVPNRESQECSRNIPTKVLMLLLYSDYILGVPVWGSSLLAAGIPIEFLEHGGFGFRTSGCIIM